MDFQFHICSCAPETVTPAGNVDRSNFSHPRSLPNALVLLLCTKMFVLVPKFVLVLVLPLATWASATGAK